MRITGKRTHPWASRRQDRLNRRINRELKLWLGRLFKETGSSISPHAGKMKAPPAPLISAADFGPDFLHG